MGLRTDRCKKNITFLIVFFVFLSLIFSFQNNIYQEDAAGTGSTQSKLYAFSSNIVDIMFAEEQTPSVLNIGHYRPMSSKVSSYGTVYLNVIFTLLYASFIIGASLLFLYIQMQDIENSHKYIIHYIHQTDGLK